MDKYALIEKINSIEGLTDEERDALVALLREHKKYGLVWEDKTEDVEERLRDSLPVLQEVKDRAIISGSPDAPNHILIEGDNLEALTTLSYTHSGKIDVIYIDPPYNRGDKDFKYNDDFIDKDTPLYGFKHSLWLSFMSKRLLVAKQLLKEDGVLIVHIDEHEFDTLNLLLREYFSEQNCLGQIIWNKMNPKGDAHAVAVMHEYIYIYCKNRTYFDVKETALIRKKPNAEAILAKAKSLFKLIGKEQIPEEIVSIIKNYGFNKRDGKPFKVTYNLDTVNYDFQRWLKKQSFSNGEKSYKYINADGRVFRTVSMAWPNKKKAPADYWIPLRHPITGEECPLPSKGWRYSLKTMNSLLGNTTPILFGNMVIKGNIAFIRKRNGTLSVPERIYFLDENLTENVPSIYEDGSSDDKLFENLKLEFPYPKTTKVAKYLIENIDNDASIILDFFAGSGTTLHATMQLNKEDGGKRQCILVTNNENNICEEVTYVRNKRVIEGYTTPKGERVEGLTGNNLRYYKTELLPREQTVSNRRRLMNAATDLLCIKNDLYKEADEFGGKPLNKDAARCFAEGRRMMLVVYNELTVDALAETIRSMDVEERIMIYVFSMNRYPQTDNFCEVLDKVELCALPAAIYDAYRHVLPDREKRKNATNTNEGGQDND